MHLLNFFCIYLGPSWSCQVLLFISTSSMRWRCSSRWPLCLRQPQMVSLLNGLWMIPPRHRPSTAIPIITVTYFVRLSVYSWVASIMIIFRG